MNPRGKIYLAVAAGSALGAVARVAIGDTLGGVLPPPWVILLVNAAGSLLIGFYATLSAPDGRLFPRPATRQFVMDGFCGGFTTFSVFSLEALRLAAAGQRGQAGAYMALSAVVWLASVWAGHAVARRINRLAGGHQ